MARTPLGFKECKQSEHEIHYIWFCLHYKKPNPALSLPIEQQWQWGIGGLNLPFRGEGESLGRVAHHTFTNLGEKTDWKLFLREDQRLGLCGETGWFLNPFLNHNALSVRSAQSIKVFEGEENNFDIQKEMGTQGVRGKFNEQLWVNF